LSRYIYSVDGKTISVSSPASDSFGMAPKRRPRRLERCFRNSDPDGQVPLGVHRESGYLFALCDGEVGEGCTFSSATISRPYTSIVSSTTTSPRWSYPRRREFVPTTLQVTIGECS
jgi:hypothetical protein